jgi:hypothetical protein
MYFTHLTDDICKSGHGGDDQSQFGWKPSRCRGCKGPHAGSEGMCTRSKMLYFTHLTDDVCIYFPKQVMAVMTNLDLGFNELGPEGAKALVPALKVMLHHV